MSFLTVYKLRAENQVKRLAQKNQRELGFKKHTHIFWQCTQAIFFAILFMHIALHFHHVGYDKGYEKGGSDVLNYITHRIDSIQKVDSLYYEQHRHKKY